MFVPFAPSSPRRRITVLAASWVLILAAWTALHGRNPIVPSPREVAAAWVELVHQGLFVRLVESYALNLQAMLHATVLSFGLAYASTIEAARPLVKLVSRLRFLGMTGITFGLGMYFGGRSLQVAMLVFGVTVFYLTSMLGVVAAIPAASVDHARTLRMGPWRTLWEVVVRGTLDEALAVLRQNAAMGWMMLTMVEGLVRSQGGVGLMLIDQNRRLDLAAVCAVQASILAVGVAQDFVLNEARKMACPYSRVAEG